VTRHCCAAWRHPPLRLWLDTLLTVEGARRRGLEPFAPRTPNPRRGIGLRTSSTWTGSYRFAGRRAPFLPLGSRATSAADHGVMARRTRSAMTVGSAGALVSTSTTGQPPAIGSLISSVHNSSAVRTWSKCPA